MFHQVLEQMMDEVVAVIEPIDVGRSIPDQVQAHIGRLVHAVTAQGVGRALFTEAVGIDGEGDDALREFYGGACERIERALRTGQGLGIVAEGDVRLKARCLLGVIKEPVFQATLYGDPIDAQILLEELVQLLFKGVLGTHES